MSQDQNNKWEQLKCPPSQRIPLAQRYFLFQYFLCLLGLNQLVQQKAIQCSVCTSTRVSCVVIALLNTAQQHCIYCTVLLYILLCSIIIIYTTYIVQHKSAIINYIVQPVLSTLLFIKDNQVTNNQFLKLFCSITVHNYFNFIQDKN